VVLPQANHLQLRVQLDTQSEPVNWPFASSYPEETDLCLEGMAEVAVKPCTLKGLDHSAGQLALATV